MHQFPRGCAVQQLGPVEVLWSDAPGSPIAGRRFTWRRGEMAGHLLGPMKGMPQDKCLEALEKFGGDADAASAWLAEQLNESDLKKKESEDEGGYECENECGFRGSFAAVCEHEAVCPLAGIEVRLCGQSQGEPPRGLAQPCVVTVRTITVWRVAVAQDTSAAAAPVIAEDLGYCNRYIDDIELRCKVLERRPDGLLKVEYLDNGPDAVEDGTNPPSKGGVGHVRRQKRRRGRGREAGEP